MLKKNAMEVGVDVVRWMWNIYENDSFLVLDWIVTLVMDCRNKYIFRTGLPLQHSPPSSPFWLGGNHKCGEKGDSRRRVQLVFTNVQRIGSMHLK